MSYINNCLCVAHHVLHTMKMAVMIMMMDMPRVCVRYVDSQLWQFFIHFSLQIYRKSHQFFFLIKNIAIPHQIQYINLLCDIYFFFQLCRMVTMQASTQRTTKKKPITPSPVNKRIILLVSATNVFSLSLHLSLFASTSNLN